MRRSKKTRVAFVTGAASGIGAATARLLAEKGLPVVCADIRAAAAGATAKAIRGAGGNAIGCGLDVTSEQSWARAMKRCVRELGRLDVLVNGAGIASNGPTADMELAEWRRVMAVNLDGVFLGTKHALRLMLEQGSGAIVNISSASGLRAIPGAAAYSTSKAAVIMFSRAVAKEVAPWGVRVNTVSPSGVKTPIWSQASFFRELVEKTGSEEGAYAALSGTTPMGRFAEPEEVAAAVWYLVNGASDYVTGENLVIDGGYTI
jgi:NAD(P)-dependent dehydrogenase (short-subunit alcohol dehydrogenase family)